jgi:hypothetical protein
MTKTIAFNTGRKYTASGQPITATLHDDGIVTFMDHARHIDGEFRSLGNIEFGSRMVMDMYDAGTYGSTKRSRDDGMMRGGCNTQRGEV